MSNRLSNAFKKKALIAYVTLGDPSIQDTLTYCKALIDAGISIIEIGIPFSDPIADGPIIQASHQAALETGEDVTVKSSFVLIKKLNDYAPEIPVVVMAATNIIMQFGYQSFFKQAEAVGCSGLIMPDCSIEMAQIINQEVRSKHVPLINLISPLCNKVRLEKIVKESAGFIYLISSTGITGERDDFSDKLSQCVDEIKAIKNIPVAVGFGVSKKEHCQNLTTFSDGIIIGSHFVKLFKEQATIHDGIAVVCERVKHFKAVL